MTSSPIRRIADLLGLVLLALLFVVCMFIIGFFSYFTLTSQASAGARIGEAYFMLGLSVFALIVIVCSFIPGLSRNRLVRFLRIPVFIGLLAFLAFQLVDAPPPRELSSLEELSTSGPEANSSSLLLEHLISDDKSPVPDLVNLLNPHNLQDIIRYRQDIETAWTGIIAKRQIIDRLSGYQVVLDIKVTDDGTPPPLHNLSRIAHIYQLYALLQASHGANLPRAVATICKLQEVAGRAMAGSTSLVQKMIWIAVARTNLRVVYRIVLDNRLMPSELLRIHEAFAPLTRRELSFTRPWLEVYLNDRHRLGLSVDELIKTRGLPGSAPPLFLRLIPEGLRMVLYRLTFQPNRTLTMLQTFWGPVIEQSQKGLLFRDIHPMGSAGFAAPSLRNLSGWYFFRPADFSAYDKLGMQLKIQTGMFIVFLNTKLRNAGIQPTYQFKDSDSMISRDNSLIYEGPDGRFDTEDDIVLSAL